MQSFFKALWLQLNQNANSHHKIISHSTQYNTYTIKKYNVSIDDNK